MYKYICRFTEVNLCLKVKTGRFKINVSVEGMRPLELYGRGLV